MRRLLQTLVMAAVVFVATGALAYWTGLAVAPEDAPPPAALPEFGTEELVVTPIPLVGEDPWDEGLAIASQIAAGRETASELGITLQQTEFVAQAIESSTPATEVTLDTFAADTTTTMPLPSAEGGEDPPSHPPGASEESTVGAVDTCTEGSSSESCPEGVAGTVLAIRDLPDLAGIGDFDPHAPGAAPYNFWPECPPTSPAPGTVPLGVATNRPAVTRVEYHPTSPHLLPPPPSGRLSWDAFDSRITIETLEIVTPDAAEPAWEAWVADDAAGYDDPRYWIDHCVSLTDLAPGRYIARFGFTDKHDDSISTTWPHLVGFTVPDAEGVVPSLRRRPTTIIGYGVDRLYVGATRTPDQELMVVAHENGNGNSCDTGSDPGQLTRPLEGRVDARVTGDDEIPRGVRFDPAYPYFREHSRSVLTRLDLTEGTNYVVCVYWVLGGGPSFEPLSIVEAESVFVAAPEAYRPTFRIHGFVNLFGTVDSASAGVYDLRCPYGSLRFEGRFQDERRLDPTVECTLDTGLTDVLLDGVAIDVSIDQADGAGRVGALRRVRTGIRCAVAPCPFRPDDLLLVPLPEIPTERRLCGSGWGSGCSGEIPMRSAGDALVVVRYDRTPGNGVSEWSIGETAPFSDTDPPLPETPRLDVSYTDEVVRDPVGGGPSGARLEVTVRADRPVSLTAEIIGDAEGGEPCELGAHSIHANGALESIHTFTLEELCLLESYEVQFTARDADGTQAVLYDYEIGDWVGTTRVMLTPALILWLRADLEIEPPRTGDWHYLTIGNLAATPDLEGTDAGRRSLVTDWNQLNWLSIPGVPRDVTGLGWFVFSTYGGSAWACGVPEAEPLALTSPFRVMYLGNTDTEVSMSVTIRGGGSPPAGAVAGGCSAGTVSETVDLRATVSLADLFAGIELTSESGTVTLRLRATRWETR